MNKIFEAIAKKLDEDEYGGAALGFGFAYVFTILVCLAILILFGNFVLEVLRIIS